jgi:hypothetical protein
MPNQDSNHDEDTTSAEPLNRAERRARRRGKKPPVPPAGPAQPPGHHDQVMVPRRSGRRGNR